MTETATAATGISDPAREHLAREILGADGNEVFFFGRLDSTGRLHEVEAVARGNAGQVPVFLERAGDWQVLIHNHPGGDLTPSPADLTIASEAGVRGLGFFIINNDATRLYRAVEPFAKEKETKLDTEEISDIFSPGGLLSGSLPDFEDREGQRHLAMEFATAFNDREVVAFEAGTGVGKSYAYLVPAILWAVRNRSRVVISTQTIALGEQLLTRDLPTLKRVLGETFTYSLIKGRTNYACRRKTREVAGAPGLFAGEDDERENWVAEILTHLEDGGEGSLSDLPRVPPSDVWADFESTTDQSLKTRCRHYRECFYYEARRRAFKSQIVVVNHHLFFADLALRRASGSFTTDLVIPGYNRVVFDEAHRLEEIASQHMGAEFSRSGIRQTLGRLAARGRRKGGRPRGRLPYLLTAVREGRSRESEELLSMEAIPRVIETRGIVDDIFAEVEERVAAYREEKGGNGRPETTFRVGEAPDDVPLDVLEPPLHRLKDVLGELRSLMRRGLTLLLDRPFTPEESYQVALGEYRSARRNLEALMGSIEMFMAGGKGMLPWFELGGGNPGRGRGRFRQDNVKFRVAPVRVAEILAEELYKPLEAVLMTSATLSVNEKWDFLGDRLGWNLTEGGRFRGAMFDSPFDFHRQSILGLPTDTPLPDTPAFTDKLPGMIVDAARAAGGRTFVLFTAHRMLRAVAERAAPELQAMGYPVLVQGEAPRIELLERFRRAGNAVLFGNQTFWEGVDVPGSALSCVFIVRLPFKVPSHPLERGRAEDLESRGKNPFMDLTVPQAALALKQGFGRLIRTTEDRGAVIIADARIQKRAYGRVLLGSLPDARRVVGPWNEIAEHLDEYFEGR